MQLRPVKRYGRSGKQNPSTANAFLQQSRMVTKKSETDKKKWVIDEPAAAIVKRIFALCLNGKGPSQIARQLEDEKILSPAGYYDSIGKKYSTKNVKNPYGWKSTTVVKILENRQYTGCTVNFKSTTVSYKVHKKMDEVQKNPQKYRYVA